MLFLAIGLVVSMTSESQRPSRPMTRPLGGMPRVYCDVEGLWGYATFEAKLDDTALAKLRAVCQETYDARKGAIGELREGDPPGKILDFKRLGDAMVEKAKEVLGDDAAKLDPWIARLESSLIRPGPRPSPPTRPRPADESAPGDEGQP